MRGRWKLKVAIVLLVFILSLWELLRLSSSRKLTLQSLLSKSRVLQHSSVLVIAVKHADDGNISLLLERKTDDYVVKSFAGNLNLYGGNKETGDKSPMDTLTRELLEEFADAEEIRRIIGESRPVGSYRVRASGEILDGMDYIFGASAFVVTITPDRAQRVLETNEGKAVLIPLDRLHNECFLWGYATIVQRALDVSGLLGSFGPSLMNCHGVTTRCELLTVLPHHKQTKKFSHMTAAHMRRIFVQVSIKPETAAEERASAGG